MASNRFKDATLIAGLVLMAVVLTGCSKSSLSEQNAYLMDENEGLRAQLVDRNRIIESQDVELRDRDGRLTDMHHQLNTAEPVMPGSDPFGNIPGVTGAVSAGEITATIESDVLFDSGKATLKAAAKRSLDLVASAISNDYSGRVVRVAGHTDRDPIRKSGYKSNHHLAFERAYAVREYLVQRGLPKDRVYVASHGSDRSVGTKSQSRRVEIAVVLNDS